MSKDELLILRKTLIKYLNKKFIRINNSLIFTFIFFIRKFNNRLRFYINYRGLNKIIYKNRYLFLLIYKIL